MAPSVIIAELEEMRMQENKKIGLNALSKKLKRLRGLCRQEVNAEVNIYPFKTHRNQLISDSVSCSLNLLKVSLLPRHRLHGLRRLLCLTQYLVQEKRELNLYTRVSDQDF